ncbi:hypothetical protein GQ457_07G025210 [Hibiscus cannabinus]
MESKVVTGDMKERKQNKIILYGLCQLPKATGVDKGKGGVQPQWSNPCPFQQWSPRNITLEMKNDDG